MYAIYLGLGGKPAPTPIEEMTEEENEALAERMLKEIQLPEWLSKQLGATQGYPGLAKPGPSAVVNN